MELYRDITYKNSEKYSSVRRRVTQMIKKEYKEAKSIEIFGREGEEKQLNYPYEGWCRATYKFNIIL